VIQTNDPITNATLETYYSYNTNYTNNSVTTSYDALGRVIQTSKGAGANQITMNMQYIGLYTNVSTDANTNIKATIMNEYGRVGRIIDYTNKVFQPANIYAAIDYHYDIRGNLTNTVDISNNVISITYDSLNRKTAMNDPDKGIWSYTYDDLGRQMTTANARGQTNLCEYDAAGRLIQKSFTNSEAPTVTYEYGTNSILNNNGRLVKVADGSGIEEYVYNERGEVVETHKIIGDMTNISASAFDALGRITNLIYPHPSTASASDIIQLKYSYEAYSGLLDRIDQINYQSGTVTNTLLSNINYDIFGRRTAVAYGNGVTTTYSYDNVKSMLQNCTIAKGQAAPLKTINYTFDNMGNLLTKDDTTEAKTEYQYDDLYRLTQTKFTAYAGGPQSNDYTQNNSYDALGNILSKDVDSGNQNSGNRGYQYDPNHPHAVASFTGVYQGDNSAGYAFTYDANGNMTQENITNNGTLTTKAFSWNGEDQLSTFTCNGTNWNYTYDYRGERIQKVRGDGDTTTYIDGMAQFRSSGNSVYSVFDGVNRIAAINEESGVDTIFYLHTDHVGTTTLVTSEDGTAYQKVVYKSFGEIYKIWKDGIWVAPTNGILDNIGSYAFTGQELDSESGLIYCGSRYYSFCTGRYISADDIIDGDGLDTQGFNRYSYCRNNPITYSDPSGHQYDGVEDAYGLGSPITDSPTSPNSMSFTTIAYNSDGSSWYPITKYFDAGPDVNNTTTSEPKVQIPNLQTFTYEYNATDVPAVLGNGVINLGNGVIDQANSLISDIQDIAHYGIVEATKGTIQQFKGIFSKAKNEVVSTVTYPFTVTSDQFFKDQQKILSDPAYWSGNVTLALSIILPVKFAKTVKAETTLIKTVEVKAPEVQPLKVAGTEKFVPNPFGKTGGPLHQETIQGIIEDINARGLIPLTEYKFPVVDGVKSVRYADVVAIDPITQQVTEIYQVGKVNGAGLLIKREYNAIMDIFKSSKYNGASLEFVPYNLK
jgi:RHS repeat-associated protein